MCVSATEPTAFSILGDYFPKRFRTTANSLMNTAHYIGYGLSTLLILSVQRFGWRQSYIIIGSAGIIMSIVGFLIIKEPERGFQIRLALEAKLRKDEEKAAKEKEDLEK